MYIYIYLYTYTYIYIYIHIPLYVYNIFQPQDVDPHIVVNQPCTCQSHLAWAMAPATCVSTNSQALRRGNLPSICTHGMHGNAFPHIGYPSIGECIPTCCGTPMYGNAFPIYLGIPSICGYIPNVLGYPNVWYAFPYTGVPQYMGAHSNLVGYRDTVNHGSV